MSAPPAHPRDTFEFVGGEAPEEAFVNALARGRMHHAWLLAGPRGVGKATLAYRVARRLLGASPAPDFGRLGAPPGDAVSKLVSSRAHPDLLVLQRDPEDGKTRKQIPVDEARALPEFFSKTPALGAARVAIIDTADDLNAFGANAVLKTLEEPPERGVILMIANNPGGLLPTLRSRCRILRMTPPPVEATARWLESRADVGEGDAMTLAIMAQGAPGLAWRMAVSDALASDAAAGALLASLPKPDPAALWALAEGFRRAEGAERFSLLFSRLAARVREMASARALAREGEGLEQWAEIHTYLTDLPRQVEAVNLDRADALYTAVSRLAALPC